MGTDRQISDQWFRHAPTCTWYLDGVCDCEEWVMDLDSETLPSKQELDDEKG